jgi:hypothetical protein
VWMTAHGDGQQQRLVDLATFVIDNRDSEAV